MAKRLLILAVLISLGTSLVGCEVTVREKTPAEKVTDAVTGD